MVSLKEKIKNFLYPQESTEFNITDDIEEPPTPTPNEKNVEEMVEAGKEEGGLYDEKDYITNSAFEILEKATDAWQLDIVRRAMKIAMEDGREKITVKDLLTVLEEKGLKKE